MSCFDRLIRADIHSLIEVKHPEQKTITALRSNNSYFLGSFSRFLYLGIGVNVSNLWPVSLQMELLWGGREDDFQLRKI